MAEMDINSIFKDQLFQDKIALISGGGTGIGLRTAKEFCKLGGKVFITARREEVLKVASEQLKAMGAEAAFFACDIRNGDQVKELMANVKETYGKLDFLINNAGGQFPSAAEDISEKGWRAVIDTNLTGTFLMSQAAFKTFFRRQKSGAIVNVIADVRNGFPNMSHTGAARAGVANLTYTLTNEWGCDGVRVNAVAPGVIASSGLDTYDDQVKAVMDQTKAFNQAHRFGTEAEVSAGILFLLSPAANFLHGVILPIDGGQSLYSPYQPPSGSGLFSSFK